MERGVGGVELTEKHGIEGIRGVEHGQARGRIRDHGEIVRGIDLHR
jgi:hypothetical protein